MQQPQLDNLVRVGHLKTEAAAAGEIEGLVRSGTRRLIDATHESLSLESRFDLAYNAGHALALAALRCRGYRSGARRAFTERAPPSSPSGWESPAARCCRCRAASRRIRHQQVALALQDFAIQCPGRRRGGNPPCRGPRG